MDIQSDQSTRAISDDQELAKVLAGVGQDGADDTQAAPQDDVMLPTPPTPMPAEPVLDPAAEPAVEDSDPMAPPVMPDPIVAAPAPLGSNLEDIKQQALGELRPLVDKLNVTPEEKFDICLLLLRSTDDRDLIAPAHEAAKAIVDESKRAQALLDIVKEIDFLSQAQ